MDREITFKNIVGTINLSELWEFKRNPELQPETTRYFLRKEHLRPILDKEGNLTGKDTYTGHIYCTGKLKENDKYIQIPMFLDWENCWIYSTNGFSFLKEAEVLEILMDK